MIATRKVCNPFSLPDICGQAAQCIHDNSLIVLILDPTMTPCNPQSHEDSNRIAIPTFDCFIARNCQLSLNGSSTVDEIVSSGSISVNPLLRVARRRSQ